MKISIRQQFIWRTALKHSLPIACGYVPAGIAYGVFMAVAGFPLWVTAAFSFFVYSGSAQYAAIPLLTTGVSLPTLMFTTLIINLRYIFYGLPILNYLPKAKLTRLYCFFTLSDESFAVITTLSPAVARNIMPYLFGLVHMFWVLPAIIGYLIGGELDKLIPNLDFAITAVFAILVCSQCTAKKIYWPVILAIITFFMAGALTPNYITLTSVALCTIFIIFESKLPIDFKISTRKPGWMILAAISTILCISLYGLNAGHELTPQAVMQLVHELPSTTFLIIATIGMALINLSLRSSASFVPKSWHGSSLLSAINTALPISILTILTLDCLHIELFVLNHDLAFFAELISTILVYIIYKYSNSMFLSIVVGILSLNISLWFLN